MPYFNKLHLLLFVGVFLASTSNFLAQDFITNNSGQSVQGYINKISENAIEIMLADSSLIGIKKAEIKEYSKGDTLFNAAGSILKLPKVNAKKQSKANEYLAEQKYSSESEIKQELEQALKYNPDSAYNIKAPSTLSNWEQALPNHVARISILNPSFIFEKYAKPGITAHFDVGIDAFASVFYENSSNKDNLIFASPYFKFEWRHYTQLADRYYFGKSIKDFSSSYYAPYIRLSLPFPDGPFWQEFGIHWGMQRDFGEHGFWNIGLGAGLKHHAGEVGLAASLEIGIGIILSRETE